MPVVKMRKKQIKDISSISDKTIMTNKINEQKTYDAEIKRTKILTNLRNLKRKHINEHDLTKPVQNTNVPIRTNKINMPQKSMADILKKTNIPKPIKPTIPEISSIPTIISNNKAQIIKREYGNRNINRINTNTNTNANTNVITNISNHVKVDTKLSLFQKDKINLIYGSCFIPDWVIIYTFYLLEKKTFEYSHVFNNNNINLINITNFYSSKIQYKSLTKQDYYRILNQCYSNLEKTIEKMNDLNEYKIALYLINNVVYDSLFDSHLVDRLKRMNRNIKIILWRDDLFTFSGNRQTSKSELAINFNSVKLDKSDLILSPSVNYFYNINSPYLNKTMYYPYSLDESLFNKLDVPYEKKINKILISGAWIHFIYEKRRQLAENYDKTMFEVLQRPNNKFENFSTTYKVPDTGMTGYYRKMSNYKACIMTLASFPLDFILGKFTEIFASNSLAILDYTYELDSRLYLNPFDDYIPILLDKQGMIIQDKYYYFKFMDNKSIYDRIVNNGASNVRQNFNLGKNTDMLCKIVTNLFDNDTSNNNVNIYKINYNFEELNMSIGHLLKLKANSRFYLDDNNETYVKDLLNIILEDRIIINTEDDQYIKLDKINPNIQMDTILGTKQENNQITIFNNNNANLCDLLIEYITKTTELPVVKVMTEDPISKVIDQLNKTKLCLVFNQKYSSFVKNCGVKNILLFDSNVKTLLNKQYNPFRANEIWIHTNNNYLDITELDKIVFMMHHVFRINKSYKDKYENLCMIMKNNLAKQEQTDKYYYFGEFGFFNTMLLGALEEYLSKTNKNILIKTYRGFSNILDSKFNNVTKRIILEEIELEKDREFHNSKAIVAPVGYNNLAVELGIKNDLGKQLFCMKTPITHNNINLQVKHGTTKYIAIFPRNRVGKYSSRNLTLDIFKKIEPIIIDTLKKNQNLENYKIIFIGNSQEIDHDILSKYKYPYYDNLEEQIFLLNNNVQLLISPDSGFIDFAKNCGVKHVIMIYKGSYITYHNKFKPFNNRFASIEYNKNISSLEKEIYRSLI
jgi:hypothetical protein